MNFIRLDEDDVTVYNEIAIVDDEIITAFVHNANLSDFIIPTKNNGFNMNIYLNLPINLKLQCVFAEILVETGRFLNSKYNFNSEKFSYENAKFCFSENIFWEYLYPLISGSNSSSSHNFR